MRKIARGQLVQFASGLRYRLRLLNQTRVHTDRLIATRFNVFDYIEPNENRLSDIIADLLNPTGNHGQGDTFLTKFAETVCGCTISALPSPLVKREDTTSFIDNYLRRIDILVDFRTFGIAVENKPWANDQIDQINDYVDHLEKKFMGNFVIVYLSPNGTDPKSISVSKSKRLSSEKKLILSAYTGLFREWLIYCYKQSKAEKIRWFLSDFGDYIEAKFITEKNH